MKKKQAENFMKKGRKMKNTQAIKLTGCAENFIKNGRKKKQANKLRGFFIYFPFKKTKNQYS